MIGEQRPPTRVLRLTPHYYWPQLATRSWPVKFDAIGGMQSQIHRLTSQLDAQPELGVEQTVLTLRLPGAPREWRMSERTTVRGVRIPVLPLRSRIRGMVDLNLAWALGVLWHLVRERRRYDVIHVHCSGVMIPPLLGWLLTKVLRVPLVLTVHCSIIVTYHPMTPLDRLMQPLARWIEKRAIRAAANTVTLTPRTIPVLSSRTGVPAERFAVRPDVIDADAFAQRATPESVAAFRARFAIPEDKPVVGYVGRIAREKGWPIILDIAQRLRDSGVHWVICGDGNERDLFEAEVAARGLDDVVTVTGYVPNEDIATVMGTMDLLLMSSLHEEFGSVMLEAMAVGLPIVAVGVGGVATVLEEGALGWLVPERTPQAFAEGIEQALADPEWRADTAERAAKTVRARYDLAQVAIAIAAVYDRTVRRGSTRDG
ncbi:glycosyltransferase family 4 protein [Actinokineospora cianjurensis]|uniref:2-deoxystreptamine N-acetyl-D-glucosaminyltransferase/2-deoxystreptamine glucosyltransferase n=1 Tax=Actinokineospora cianjurensis TaxID=585224 RepID=A0A421B1J2_9PSEU|nr:glycosyltransferase family 4 protein [Actinokineospora cianjurensis]RLK58198.1 2-deoxystreptamine N-acetyl-D-glucosaminyltransferase/2-deoxystreptamine glucosyltransferase [Actinokineospora cianjurensis]